MSDCGSAGDYIVIVTSGNCSQISNTKSICPNNKNITGIIFGPSDNADEHKAININASNKILNSSVEFKAAKAINLYPGFVISSRDYYEATYFKAEIGGCN